MKYRRKADHAITVKAFEYKGTGKPVKDAIVYPKWGSKALQKGLIYYNGKDIYIANHSVRTEEGDFIIKYMDGMIASLDPKTFHDHYEPIPEESPWIKDELYVRMLITKDMKKRGIDVTKVIYKLKITNNNCAEFDGISLEGAMTGESWKG